MDKKKPFNFNFRIVIMNFLLTSLEKNPNRLMATPQSISLVLMSALYLLAGISHFIQPRFFLKIIPKWVPYPELTNFVVGAVEVLLGMALWVSEIRSYAAMGVILLLLAVFPANVYHFQKARRKGQHVAATAIRLPFQALLIYWAYTFV